MRFSFTSENLILTALFWLLICGQAIRFLFIYIDFFVFLINSSEIYNASSRSFKKNFWILFPLISLKFVCSFFTVLNIQNNAVYDPALSIKVNVYIAHFTSSMLFSACIIAQVQIRSSYPRTAKEASIYLLSPPRLGSRAHTARHGIRLPALPLASVVDRAGSGTGFWQVRSDMPFRC